MSNFNDFLIFKNYSKMIKKFKIHIYQNLFKPFLFEFFKEYLKINYTIISFLNCNKGAL